MTGRYNNRRIVDRDRDGERDAVFRQDLDQRFLVLKNGRITLSLDALRDALGIEAIAAQAAAGVTIEPAATEVAVFEGAGADGLVPDPGSETGLFLKDDGTWAAPGGGGGGAPTGSAYVTIGNDGTLTAERALTGSGRISVTDGGANNGVTLDIPDGGVTRAKLADGTGNSVIGRAANTNGPVADIGATTTGQVLRQSGSVLGFGKIGTDSIDINAVDNTQLANMPNGTYKARITAGTGDPEDVSMAGATFPSSPIDGQRFYRTDLSCLFFWHQTYAAWLSVNTYELDYGWASTVATNSYFYFFQGTGAARFTASNGHFFGFATVVVGVTIRPSTPTANLTAQVRANGANVTNAFVSTTGGGARNSKENIQTSAVIAADALISVFNTGSAGTGSTSGGGKIRLRRREV